MDEISRLRGLGWSKTISRYNEVLVPEGESLQVSYPNHVFGSEDDVKDESF